MKVIAGGVTAPKGFLAADTAAGIKYQGRTDMAMVYSEADCTVAGTFTTNVVKAAPVIWDRDVVVKGGSARAIIVNSGIANACTGKEGMDICDATAKAAAQVLSIRPEQVCIGSTGVIGMQIPKDRIVEGVNVLSTKLESGEEASLRAAKAIMTTDTVHKMIAVEIELSGKTVTIGAMTKGSGMIHPNMATMLVFVTSDVDISPEMLQKALSSDVEDSFNMISVDGDTSTNDMVSVMASGLAGNKKITGEGEDYSAFCEALGAVTKNLCRKIANDGEGATKLITCRVSGAKDKPTAKIVAKSVISSSLFKAAMFGADANWGRVLCAIGYSGANVGVNKVDVAFHSAAGTVEVCKNGAGLDFSEEFAKKVLLEKEIEILVELNSGEFSSTAWGCDLTYDYVKINGDYRT